MYKKIKIPFSRSKSLACRNSPNSLAIFVKNSYLTYIWCGLPPRPPPPPPRNTVSAARKMLKYQRTVVPVQHTEVPAQGVCPYDFFYPVASAIGTSKNPLGSSPARSRSVPPSSFPQGFTHWRRRLITRTGQTLRRGMFLGLALAFLAGVASLGFSGSVAAQTTPTLSVSVDDAHILEGQNATITFRLSEAASEQIEYRFAASRYGNAVIWDVTSSQPGEGIEALVTKTFEIGEQKHTLTVDTQADGGVEDTWQSFWVVLKNRSQYQVHTDSNAVAVEIADDYDYYRSLSISVAGDASSVNEGQEAPFKITRTGGLSDLGVVGVAADAAEITVNFQMSEEGYVFLAGLVQWRLEGDAVFETVLIDPPETASVTLPAGVSEVVVEVATYNDSVPEVANTAAILKIVDGPSDAPYIISSPGTASVGVNDFGRDTPEIKFVSQHTSTTVSEDTGPVQFAVQQIISDAPVDLTVHLSEVGDYLGTPPNIQVGLYRSAGQPFVDAVQVTPTTLASGDLEFTIPFEEYEADDATRIVRVNLDNDNISEADGSITLTAPAQHGASEVSATVTVTNDDLPYVDMTAGALNISEGGSITFTLTRDGDLTQPLTIDGNDLTSYFTPAQINNPINHTVTFAADSSTATFSISAEDDNVFYPSRQLNVTLRPGAVSPFRLRATPPSGASSGSDDTHTTYHRTVTDNDKAKLTIAPASVSVVESGQACFRLGVDDVYFHPFQGYNVTFNLAVTENGSFLTAQQARTLLHTVHQIDAIAANDSNYDICVDLDDDDLDEASGTVTMEVTGPTNTYFEVGADSTATVMVTDNDLPTITVTASPTPLNEGDLATFTFTRHGDTTDPLTIAGSNIPSEYGPYASDSPYAAWILASNLATTVTFSAGSATATATRQIRDDTHYHPALYLQVTLTSDPSSYRAPSTLPPNAVADLSDANKTVYRFPIIESDQGKVSITAVDPLVNESEQACYAIDVNGIIDSVLSVGVLITEEAAFLLSNQDKQFVVDMLETPHEVCLDLDDDSASEDGGNVTMQLVSSGDTRIIVDSAASAADVWVTDNDLPVITMTTDSTQVSEGGEVEFTVTRTGDISKEFTIEENNLKYWISDYRNYVSKTSIKLTFASGVSTVKFRLSAPNDQRFHVYRELVVNLVPTPWDPLNATYEDAYFTLPDVIASGSLPDQSDNTAYSLEIIDDEIAEVSVQPVTTPVSEADQACFEISSNAVWHPRRDFQVPFTLDVTETGGYLDSPVSVISGEFRTQAAADDETVVEKCLALHNDRISEHDGSVTVTLRAINKQGFTVSTTNGTATVVVTDDEADPAPTVDVQMQRRNVAILEGQTASIEMSRWSGGSSGAPSTQPVTVRIKYRSTDDGTYLPDVPFSTRSVTIPANQQFQRFPVPTVDRNFHVQNYKLEVFVIPDTNYVVRPGYESVKVRIENTEAIQQVGFWPWELSDVRRTEAEGPVKFILRRSYRDPAPLTPLDVNIRVSEFIVRSLSETTVSYNGGNYGNQQVNERTYGRRLSGSLQLLPPSSTGTVGLGYSTTAHFNSGDETVEITLDLNNDGLEELASVVQVEIDAGSGYKIIGDTSPGEVCTFGDTTLRGCGKEWNLVADNDQYEHWMKVTAVNEEIDEGEDAVFRVERFATTPVASSANRCTLANPESASGISYNLIDYRRVEYDVSGHETVQGTNFPQHAYQRIAHIPASNFSTEVRLPTTDDSVDESDASLEFTLREVLNSIDPYRYPYYCIVPSAGSATVTVRDNDNDDSGITVTPATLTVAEGDSTTYEVVLDAEPSGDVTVAVSLALGSDADITVSTTSLTFTPENWDVAQEVTVSAAEDSDALNGNATIEHAASGSDYGGASTASVTATESDNDTAGVTVTSTTLAVAEGNNTTYEVVLDTQPAGDVTVTASVILAEDVSLTVMPLSLTFTTSTWNVAQEVTVSAAEDPNALNGNAAIGHAVSGADYASVTASSVAVTESDNDATGVTVTPTALTVTEGSDATYLVVLSTEPSDDVTIAVSLASGADEDITLNTTSLTFTSDTWNTAQEVTVSAAEDADAVNGSATIEHAASGGDYAGITVSSVTATESDNDTAGIMVTPTPLFVGEGYNVTYEVVLDTQPSGNVTVTVSGATAYLTVSSSSLTFTPSNWNTAQELTVTATADNDSVDDEETLSHSAAGGGYDGVSMDLPVTILDAAGLPTVTIESGAHMAEEGENVTFTLSRTGSPSSSLTAYVTVSETYDMLASDQEGEYEVEFLAGSSTVQLSISTVDDATAESSSKVKAVIDSKVHYQIGQPGEAGLDVFDNDMFLEVSLTAQTVTVGEGASSVRIFLTAVTDTAPTGPTIMQYISASGTAEKDVDFTEDTFNYVILPHNNFSVVDVNGVTRYSYTGHFDISIVDDGIVEDPETFTVSIIAVRGHTVNLGVSEAAVTINDDETPGITVNPTALDVAEGSSATYTVVLTTEPADDVEVSVSLASGADEDITLNTTSLSFTPDDWDTAQTVRVSAAEDVDAINGSATLTHTAINSGYDRAPSSSVTATESDNDTANVTVTPTTLTVPEGSSQTYEVVLTTEPSDDVTIGVSLATGADSDITLNTTSLTFTPDNWSTVQEVTVSAAEDADAVAGEATIEHAVSGGGYDAVTVSSVTATESDNDTAGFGLKKIGGPGDGVDVNSLTINEGTEETYTVALTSLPSSDLTVTVSGFADTDVGVSPSSFTFTPENWSVAQDVTVSAAEDDDAVNDMVELVYLAIGSDYDGVTESVTVTVRDNDTTGVTVTPTTLPVPEGSSATYTVVLTSEPSADVTIGVSLAFRCGCGHYVKRILSHVYAR